MKILIGPDLHCWPTTYESAPKNETPHRLMEWKNIAQAIVNIVRREKPLLGFFPGDLFDVANTKPLAIIEIVNFFKKLKTLHCNVIACAGNHDFIGPGETNFVNLVAELGNPLWGITEPKSFKIEEYDTYCTVIPYIKPTLLDSSGKIEAINKRLLELVTSWKNAKYKILMTHWPVKESIYANGFGPKNEPTYSLDDLKNLEYDVCIMGHVHKNQILHETNPLVIHPGTAILTELNEASVVPKVFIYDLETKELKAEELPVRKIAYLKFSDKICNFESKEWETEIFDVKDKIVIVKYKVPENIAPTIDQQIIVDTLYEKGAFHVEGIYPTIIKKERARRAEIDCSLSRVEAFEKWYNVSGENPELKDKVLLKFKELEKEV